MASQRRCLRSRIASAASRITPIALEAMHTQAKISLLVATAATRDASPITANTTAMISIGQPLNPSLRAMVYWAYPPSPASDGAAEPRWPSSSSWDSR